MATEVFNRIGESEIYEGPSNGFYKKRNYDNEDLIEEKGNKKRESETKSPISDAKREFLEHMNDDSLSLDTASNVTRDWGNRD